ncbi:MULTISPECIES: hypothetical protein [unclassified Mesorhizobium]|uniref:hypothetical protein n=1 Tax=unclassified Mesorhizobium TaxID=325217 RepID=UPI001129395F|nr:MULTISPECIES: hypothetical protein [unclassified Mesorhizobium]TPJ86914.1 hypothetical protein FJ489_30640 [Mesorhizobium sp. B2-5-12]TPK19137.1 hypothetical protein FJ562_31045 [Mesorhizobium sp. B2-5-6]
MRLTEAQIEDGMRFSLGDLVKIESHHEWADEEWSGVVGEVIGIIWDHRKQDWNIALRHDGDQITNGFRVDDLGRLALTSGRKPE